MNFINNEVSGSAVGHFCANVIGHNIAQFVTNDLLRFIYHTEWHDGFIKGVEPGTDDDRWVHKIHMNNSTNSCGPISAAMILNWHDKINYDHKGDYQIALPSEVAGGIKVSSPQDPFEYYENCTDIEKKKNMEWILHMGEGEIAHNTLLSHIIEQAMKETGFSGRAKYASLVSHLSLGALNNLLGAEAFIIQAGGSAASAFSLIGGSIAANRLFFNDFRRDVNNNQPGIVGMFGYYENGVYPLDQARLGGHYMPVIGYKYKTREMFNIDTIVFDELYLYTDTTWWNVGKKFYRIDVWSRLNSALGRVQIRVYDNKNITVEEELEYSGKGTRSEARDWYVLINGKRIPDYYNAVLAEDRLYVFRKNQYGDRGYVPCQKTDLTDSTPDSTAVSDCFPDADYTLTDSDKAAGWCETGGRCTVPSGWMFVKREGKIWAVRANKLEVFAETMKFTEFARDPSLIRF